MNTCTKKWNVLIWNARMASARAAMAWALAYQRGTKDSQGCLSIAVNTSHVCCHAYIRCQNYLKLHERYFLCFLSLKSGEGCIKFQSSLSLSSSVIPCSPFNTMTSSFAAPHIACLRFFWSLTLSPMAPRRREVSPGRSLPSTTGDVYSQPARLTSGSFLWPSRFFSYDTITYPNENDPWSKYQLEFDNPEDEISFFLSTGLEHARYEGRIRPVLDVCADATLDDLLCGEIPGPLRKAAWLIDGHWSEETWVSRPCLGALSARQLTIELLKKVMICSLIMASNYRRCSASDIANRDTLIQIALVIPTLHWSMLRDVWCKRYFIPVSCNQSQMLTRLRFINDFDRWSLLALVKTCPRPHARQLGDFFHKHLCARPSIGVCFPVRLFAVS